MAFGLNRVELIGRLGADVTVNHLTSQTSMMARTVEKEALASEVLANDARRAAKAMARIVKGQFSRRVALGPPDQ